jgi:DNA-directed RNA polymerase subunit RPC12/RpoP
MAEIKFSCPTCQQHIEADAGYAGMQIACPACKSAMTVPGTPVAPAAAPSIPAPAYTPPPPPSAAPARASAAPAAAAAGCPSCGSALPRGAVLCTHCGYNLATKQRTVAGRPAALGKPTAAKWETPWYKTAYPYVGAVVVALAILYLLGRSNPVMMLAFLGVAVLYVLVAHILVVISAFKESVGTGFLTMCIPFYGLYYVFKVSEDETLQILYTVAIVINLAVRFIGKS